MIQLLNKIINFFVNGLNNINSYQRQYNNDQYNLKKFKLMRKKRYNINDEV